MKKIKLTEKDLTKIISQVISEQSYRGGIIKEGDGPCEIWCKRKSAQEGSRGKVVKMIQQLLSTDGGLGDYFYGYDNVGVNDGCAYDWENCDGKFGPDTKKTIEKFQEEYGQGLEIDGKVGFNTLTALCNAIDQEWMSIHGKDWIGFTLCDKPKCDCIEQEDISIIDGIDDVIENIDCDGECDIDDWCDNPSGNCDGDHWNDCERIKACLYYASRKDNENWHYFLQCMQGRFGTRYN
tara:strand:- start:269 stop:979 length:711 start_codon:yes stop_codon:yes gene_type:complete